MTTARLTPPYQKVMNALEIKRGGRYTGAVNRLVQRWMSEGVTVEEAIQRLPATPEYQRWRIITDKEAAEVSAISAAVARKEGTANTEAKNAPKRAERVKEVFSIAGIEKGSPGSKKMVQVVRQLVAKYADDAEVVEVLKRLPQWEAREKLIESLRSAEALRVEKARQGRIEKGKHIANLPRDKRVKAWGVIRVRVAKTPYSLTVTNTMRATDAHFAALVAFASHAQKERDAAEARRLAEIARRQKEEKERIEYQRQQELNRIEIARKREKERQQRLSQLDIEVAIEEAQEYMREHIPAAQLLSFRAWYVKNHGTDHSLLKFGVDEYNATFNTPDVEAFAELEEAPTPVAKPNPTPVAKTAPAVKLVASKRKREGRIYGVRSRPDQANFSAAVRANCFETCVVTGARLVHRCEAAHLVEHKNHGIDCYTNGLWMRADIHDLFDAGDCAINPETMVIYFKADALALDADLATYHGQQLRATRKPINPAFLAARWAAFCNNGQ